MIRCYIAGPLTPTGRNGNAQNAAIEYLMNVKAMLDAAVALIKKGHAPFCPGVDYSYFLSLSRGETITEKEIRDYSLAWLAVCDAILLLPGSETSKGVQAEYQLAVNGGLMIYNSLEEVPGV
jgi:hypothetical protein